MQIIFLSSQKLCSSSISVKAASQATETFYMYKMNQTADFFIVSKMPVKYNTASKDAHGNVAI